ncbi:MAG: hypothetical protein A2Y67_03390 [Candidatus Buchananbacteria bacterium RBG_13_39_9]|uniref:DUF4340 domain-containing protein n=1 Tax=Candidatus Buchananbacteria bacterium RBG_13_39_9 TaxID=1797531 RepID=A0A1G1XSR3_9BACT|nr:MAG: hypothetical protein A2Y67_03390 [Candidatus Buchananbacteria bacterium RBG_13_39_9]
MTSKTKKFITLIIILIILVAVFIFWQNPLNHKTNNGNTEEISTANLDNAQKIEISKGDKTTILQKENDKWLVSSENNAEANLDYINKLIDALKEVKQGTIISQNKDKLATFELAEGQYTKVKLSDSSNNILLELLVGKMGPAYTQSYVKKLNSDNVLLINQNLLLSITPNSWIKPPETNTNSTK